MEPNISSHVAVTLLTVSAGGRIAGQGGGQVIGHAHNLQLACPVWQQLQPSLKAEDRGESVLRRVTQNAVTRSGSFILQPLNNKID